LPFLTGRFKLVFQIECILNMPLLSSHAKAKYDIIHFDLTEQIGLPGNAIRHTLKCNKCTLCDNITFFPCVGYDLDVIHLFTHGLYKLSIKIISTVIIFIVYR
jgi:hypothetical protein